MGRGDKKSRKGKIFRGSSGNSRLKTKHPTSPLSQPDPSKIGLKKDSIKKLADARPAPSERKPVDKKSAEKKQTEKKTAVKAKKE
ncbi:MAG: 30S ribosomal protein THX [Candidatus Delongbacteria bacterium]|nr:30S ribosomal protein THX [Candidatus Delongbacteria bacterium]MCG2761199.1 30S ribosomal protein THX [Candidatus Delongbacteria bacterium]